MNTAVSGFVAFGFVGFDDAAQKSAAPAGKVPLHWLHCRQRCPATVFCPNRCNAAEEIHTLPRSGC